VGWEGGYEHLLVHQVMHVVWAEASMKGPISYLPSLCLLPVLLRGGTQYAACNHSCRQGLHSIALYLFADPARLCAPPPPILPLTTPAVTQCIKQHSPPPAPPRVPPCPTAPPAGRPAAQASTAPPGPPPRPPPPAPPREQWREPSSAWGGGRQQGKGVVRCYTRSQN
jgi:hypothetical protein